MRITGFNGMLYSVQCITMLFVWEHAALDTIDRPKMYIQYVYYGTKWSVCVLWDWDTIVSSASPCYLYGKANAVVDSIQYPEVRTPTVCIAGLFCLNTASISDPVRIYHSCVRTKRKQRIIS